MATFDPETEKELQAYRDALAQAQQRRQGADIVGIGETIGNTFRAAGGSPAIAAADRILGARGPAAEPFQANLADRLRQQAEEPLQQFQQESGLRQAFAKRAAEQAKALREQKELESQSNLRSAQQQRYEQLAESEGAQLGIKTEAADRAERGMELRQREIENREKYLEQQRADKQREQAQRRADKEQERTFRREERQIDLEQKALTKQQTAEQKKAGDVIQVEGFGQNILRNLGKLEQMLGPGGPGTFEALGPDAKIMGALINEIAVDSAKLADPGSVAREGEVALEKSKLWDPQRATSALSLTNDTARKLLQNYKERVKDRIKSAYEVRGISPNASRAQAGEAAAPAEQVTVGPRTPSGKPYARKQVSKDGTKVRYLDAEGKEVK